MLLAYGRGLLTMRLVANRLPSLGAAIKKVRIMKPPPDRAALSTPGQTRFSICENQYKTYQKQQTITWWSGQLQPFVFAASGVPGV